MGLLAKYFDGGAAVQSAMDDVLLLHGMMCMAGADGVFEQAEIALLEASFSQLPEFRGKDFDELVAEARQIVSKYRSALDSVEALAELSSPGVKAKMFVLAVELALAGGSLDQREDMMLEAMQRVLDIDAVTAAKVVEVISMKYARA